VIDHESYLRLQDIIRREGRSLLQYAGESFPWTTPDQKAVLDGVQTLVREEREGAASLSRYLAKNHLTPPYLGAYPSYFTSYNFMALDKLLPLLVVHQKRGLVDLESDLRSFADGEGQPMLQGVVDLKRRHLQVLESLAGTVK
jgi:hypothetical protein